MSREDEWIEGEFDRGYRLGNRDGYEAGLMWAGRFDRGMLARACEQVVTTIELNGETDSAFAGTPQQMADAVLDAYLALFETEVVPA